MINDSRLISSPLWKFVYCERHRNISHRPCVPLDVVDSYLTFRTSENGCARALKSQLLGCMACREWQPRGAIVSSAHAWTSRSLQWTDNKIKGMDDHYHVYVVEVKRTVRLRSAGIDFL